VIIDSNGYPTGHFKKTLSFDDVLLTPNYSDIESRSEINTTNILGSHELVLPIISSPMDTVTGVDMATSMALMGGMGIVHRYSTVEKQVEIVEDVLDYTAESMDTCPVAAAIGVSGDFLDRAKALYEVGVTTICVDVAHGHHILMERALKTLKDTFGERMHIIAGNVATLKAFNDLASWGADSIKVGIGGGSICSTRIKTGHGMPTLQSIFECAQSDKKAKLIADGGIKTSGDIVKALAAGADFVMLGSLLAGTDESPGGIHTSLDGKKYKVYRGMASHEAQMDWRGKISSLEGVSTTIPYKGSVTPILSDLKRGIRSGFSYSGARTLEELHAKAKFIQQTSSGQQESSTHILRRNNG
tara:strand:+ start:3639 stop:4712 length:1074 start_codon:yes stop_codon:yes gene_type:complete